MTITTWYKIIVPFRTSFFIGYFSVISNPGDTTGIINHFYDVSNIGVDIFINNGLRSQNNIFDISNQVISGSVNITSLPQAYNYNAVCYNLSKQYIRALNSSGNILYTYSLPQTFILLPGPLTENVINFTDLWYSVEISEIPTSSVIFNGYFSVITYSGCIYGIINHFYDYSNIGVDIFENAGLYHEDNVFNIYEKKFSSKGISILSLPALYYDGVTLYNLNTRYVIFNKEIYQIDAITIVYNISYNDVLYFSFNINEISGPPQNPSQEPPNMPLLINYFSMSNRFSNNASVYYKTHSLSTGGGGSGVRNCRHKQFKT